MAKSKIETPNRCNAFGPFENFITNQMKTFDSDGYVSVSCSSTSSSAFAGKLYGANDNGYINISLNGGNVYPNICFFVRKGMRMIATRQDNNAAATFAPLNGGVVSRLLKALQLPSFKLERGWA